MSYTQVTENDVKNIVLKSTSCMLDQILTQLLLDCIHIVSTQIISHCLKLGMFPIFFKTTVIELLGEALSM